MSLKKISIGNKSGIKYEAEFERHFASMHVMWSLFTEGQLLSTMKVWAKALLEVVLLPRT